MAEWQAGWPVQYSSASDENIDSWVQKYISEINRLYELLGRLRRLDGGAVELTDTVAYQLRADFVTNELRLRNKDNTGWLVLGKLEEKFGHTPDYLGAVANRGGAPSIQMGMEADRPRTDVAGAIYIAHDTKKNYRYTAAGWEWMDVLAPEDIATAAAPGKLLRLNADGKLPADLAGKADEATHADEADHAADASHADEADHALRADEATHSTNSESAKYAATAGETERATVAGKLETACKINGVPFDGTRNINIGVAGDGQEAIDGYQSLLWRTAANEREISNIALALEDLSDFPDYNELLAERFKNGASDIDQFGTGVTSVVAGSDNIDVASLHGIRPGSWYTLTDGAEQEAVQVKAVAKNGGVLRVMLASPVVKTYAADAAMLYRTTAQIEEGRAQGAGDKKATAWRPALVWQGVQSSVAATETLETTQANAEAFTITPSISFTVSGMVTLSPTRVTGIALIAGGGGGGNWDNYEGRAE